MAFMSDMINRISGMVDKKNPNSPNNSDKSNESEAQKVTGAAKNVTSAMQIKPTKMSSFLQ